MAQGITHLSADTFDEMVGASEIPIVVDFWAEWCGPCKQIGPILEEIQAEHGESLAITKLNVDDNPDLAMKYNVMSIPTLLVFNGGEVEKRLVGAKSKGALLQELAEFLPPTV
jgi:thioredoxin 1